jgi:hypothetical protein
VLVESRERGREEREAQRRERRGEAERRERVDSLAVGIVSSVSLLICSLAITLSVPRGIAVVCLSDLLIVCRPNNSLQFHSPSHSLSRTH